MTGSSRGVPPVTLTLFGNYSRDSRMASLLRRYAPRNDQVGITAAGRVSDILCRHSASLSSLAKAMRPFLSEIGRAHVRTPVTNAQLVCRLLLEKKNTSLTCKH